MHHFCRLKIWALDISSIKEVAFSINSTFPDIFISDIFILIQFKTHYSNEAWGNAFFCSFPFKLINYTSRKSAYIRQKSVILLETHLLTPLLSNPFCMLFFPPSTMVAVVLLHGRSTYNARLKFTSILDRKTYKTWFNQYSSLIRYFNNYNNVRKLFSIALLHVRWKWYRIRNRSRKDYL